MQAFYDNQPKKLEAVGNGSFRYRYNIREEEKPVQVRENSETSEQAQPQIKWVCEEVTVWMPLTPNRITAAVITEAFPANYEQKLLNEYNAANLGMIPDKDETEKRRKAYTDFLRRRAELKKEIDAFCAEKGIR